ncbi:peripheral-type benzodiazepine receptor-associated protein 1 isoform X4 [Rana temporaria]|uniref:peripheral-type benzodiazepine receptor-associated protein 1 isoform X4 n=1 Tax=Rana temporaria TaxID=8407 RepID=UPI001AAD1D86|nr:peripheral-type benzodiazepine receptor-associated protein 1 isoform X4 [Rana temporaria]
MFNENLNNSQNCLLEEYKRDLELLKKELQHEKQEARKRYNSELMQFKENCEKEKNKLVNDLTSRWEQQKSRELQQLKDSSFKERELEIKQMMRWKEEEIREVQMFLQKERDSAIKQARELQKQLLDELLNKGNMGKGSSNKKNEPNSPLGSECHCKVQDVLSKLRWDYDGEQAARIRYLKVELDLERSLFVKYILDRSDNNASAILKDTTKPLGCQKIKFGRHSLGSSTARQWSLEETSSRPSSIENTGFRHHSGKSALSRTKSLESAFPRPDSPLNSTEKSWKESPENERLIMPIHRDFPAKYSSEMTFALLEAKNDCKTWSFLQEGFHQNSEEPTHNSSNTTESNSSAGSLDLSDFHQTHDASAQNVSILQSCLNADDGSQSTQELLNALRDLEQRCKDLQEENIILRKSSVPETEEKVKRLKRKNAELAVIAKRLEERAQKLQEANLKMVNTPIHLKGASLELCKKAFARQRAKDMREQASALLEKDKQIENLKQECEELQAKLSAGKDFPSLLKFNDFNRLLHESQKEVLRLQKQIALKYMKESLHLSRTESHSSPTPAEAMYLNRLIHPEQPTQDPDNSIMATSVDSFKEVELRRKRKECEILEQEVKKKQKRCEELEIKLQEVQSENERLVEENSRLCGSVKWAAKVEAENADLKRHLSVVTEKRDSALKENHRLHSKLENLEQVLRHMRDVVERRQQLEKDHEDATIALQKRQEEVKRLQQAQVEAKKEHEGAVHLLENTLDTLQATVKVLEEKCRSQTEQFSLLSHELEKFRLQTGNIDLLTSTLVNSELPPPQCCSTPSLSSVQQDTTDEFSSWDVISWVDISLDGSSPSFIYLSFDDVNDSVFRIANEKNKPDQERRLPETPEQSSKVSNVETPKHAAAKEKQKPEAPHTSSKSESIHESSKSCPTPEVDTASEMEELEPDSVSINPEPETRSTATLQVFLARYSYNPFDGPNENPEAELPLTAGEYIYIYGDMDDDGFYEGELMDGRRGLVPSNFVERVSDDDLIASHPGEANELSQSSAPDISFLSGSSIERSEEDDDPSSLSPLPLQGTGEGAAEVSAVPYPRKLALIKQLARSVVVGWDPPLVAAGSGNILSYNIYVDNELRQNVRCGGQTKALIEKLELKTRTYRISVQSMTENGCSDRMRCTMLVGHGYTLAPTQLRVRSLSATSAEITWQPCNSNYSHALYLNEESCGLTKAGTYWYTFGSLRPSTMYNVKVEARPQRIPLELPMERREPKATVMQLTTPAAGPPDAPLDVQVELGPKPGVLLITWLPVTIDAAGTSNGVRVTGYAVYADGQKVLEVTSPTAGSVLVGTSHLHLLQVSREISVRTMSPSGESVDSVPAQIPSAFIKVQESPSLSQTFSNSSLTSEQPLASLPSMPLISSSPCSLHNEATSTLKANLSTHASSSRGDSLPVRIAPHLSPLSASSGYCQGSSSLEPSEVQVSCQGTQEKISSSLPDSATHSFPGKIVSNCLEISKIALQSEGAALQNNRKPFLDTKEFKTGDQAMCGLPLGVTWKKENTIELNATNTKEDCSSPEAGLSEDAENTTSSLSFRGVSIDDFLEVDKTEGKESSGSNVMFENEDAGELPLDTHSSTAHIDHSRSSNLSDILEEEEYEEEEDSSVVPSAQKWAQTSRNPVTDSSGKLDSCETDSDEEIFERILDLPLQKHCSKKLFSIPEVTEEEDEEEEENPAPSASCKAQLCNVEIPKCHYVKTYQAFPQKAASPTCANLSTERCCRDFSGNSSKPECSVDDCVFQDWQQRTGSCVSQSPLYSVKSPVSESTMWNAKKNSSVNERAHCTAESNKKKQSEGKEHCSRLSSNANQALLYNSRGHDVKEPVFCGTTREGSQVGHRNIKVSRSYQKHQSFVPTNVTSKSPSTFSSRHLEIDIEYDTEDEDDLSVPTYYTTRTKDDIWEDSSQTDREGWSESSDYSEPIRFTKRKEAKRQPEMQTGTTECLKRHTSLLHIDQMHGDQQGSNKDQGRTASNKTMRTVRWESARKDEWNEEPKVPLHPDNTGTAALEKKTRLNHLALDSEPDVATTLAECHQDNRFQEKESISQKPEVDSIRMFVALFDYDPETMSPNPDAYMEELPFKEGQILQVFGDKDTDGFYRGKHGGRTGYIPCNMVSELHIESEEVRRELLRQGHLTSPSLMNDLDKHLKTSKSDSSIARKMVAMFDYNPRESSPNMDVEAELSFTAGDIITVFGPMDEDGFFYGELNAQRGFVPSNYLEVSQTQTEELTSQGTVQATGEKFSCDVTADQPYSPPNVSLSSDQPSEPMEATERMDQCQEISSTKKRKSFFSKGRKLFKKLGSSGKNL